MISEKTLFQYVKGLVNLFMVLTLSACVSKAYLPTESVSENAAVLRLYEESESYFNAGDFESAQARSERALRIESNNPFVWYKLAQIAKATDDYYKAREIANRALGFAANKPALRSKIERFIQGL